MGLEEEGEDVVAAAQELLELVEAEFAAVRALLFLHLYAPLQDLFREVYLLSVGESNGTSYYRKYLLPLHFFISLPQT